MSAVDERRAMLRLARLIDLVTRGKVDRNSLVSPRSDLHSCGCKHHIKRHTISACGGCFARLYLTLSAIADGVPDAQRLARDVFEAMKEQP